VRVDERRRPLAQLQIDLREHRLGLLLVDESEVFGDAGERPHGLRGIDLGKGELGEPRHRVA
jgi:hypothetical protein